ncbi:DUF4230 domain-containing protein [Erythrobacteraceae bacterium CFH 75059]|nr:DUF4230 domain-containing protein [Erythrobacteraceae bacterium CFH 75059]
MNRAATGAPHTAPRAERPLARVQAAPWLLVIVLLAAVAWLTWRAFFHQQEGDPVGSAMLAFERQNALTVLSSRFEVVAESENTQRVLGVPVLQSRQATIVPATVEYRLDLSGMGRDDFTWDPAAQRLTVTLPPLQTTRPNIDESAARVFTEGAFVTREAAVALARNNSVQAERKASEFARNPEVLGLARQAAAQAVRQNLAIPLQVAGYTDATVEVRFAGDPAPG